MDNENILESEENPLDDSETASDVPADTSDYQMLIEYTQMNGARLENIQNVCIVAMVGVALMVGILACSIFAKYFRG